MFERIENRTLKGMIERALYPGIVADLDVEKIASVLPAVKTRGFEMREEGKRLTGQVSVVSVRVHRVKMGGTRFSVRYCRPKDPPGYNRFRSMRFPHRHGPTGLAGIGL